MRVIRNKGQWILEFHEAILMNDELEEQNKMIVGMIQEAMMLADMRVALPTCH